MSVPQEPGKSLPPTEYSLKYISWHQKDIVTQLKLLNEQMQNLCTILREMTGNKSPVSSFNPPSNQDIPF